MEGRTDFRKPVWGLITFAILLIALIFIGGIVQYYWGMWGLALTEVMFALLAVLFIKAYRFDIREVLPIRRPTWRAFFGVVLMWVGTYLLVLVASTALMYFFPEGMQSVSEDLTGVLYSVSAPLVILIACVMPAVCEEMINRGVILYTMGGLKERYQILIVGLLFGVFHLSLYRFIPTALLGIALTYIMVKTKNILMPVLYHLINNLFATVPSLLAGGAAESASLVTRTTIGSVMILAAFAPVVILAAARLLCEKTPEASAKKKTPAVAAVVLGIMILAGGVLLLKSAMHEPFRYSQTYTLSSGQSAVIPAFNVSESDGYTVYMKLMADHGLAVVSMLDENGGEVFSFSAASYTGTQSYALAPGTYYIVITALATQRTSRIITTDRASLMTRRVCRRLIFHRTAAQTLLSPS
jgi:membrane protease YdiL (CAAX protease family)